MITTVTLLTRRDDLGHDEFVDHYEHHHVPLVLSRAPAPDRYTRHYLPPRDQREDEADFDVVTTVSFADEEARRSWLDLVLAEDSGVAEDEARFLDRGRTRSWTVREFTGTTGSPVPAAP
ncbi:EthD domain-containing protein [Amycolatopsis sp. PS_44_ISF1]|uniref:EthD domain-containing protein n=1 Tax=Amycolatopsis sp. PS_44_ISF1 TaxID=2974917 RepID=UPI0028DFF96A|nr:EthD domain-containing protein [Amycolatopsis sp. PS_44_ISF1]MDT8911989.1 EthD domain-containing protein [Amycolatopsis sp. PS_44_ISF1]